MSKIDKYEIIKNLGSGMFGDTYLVKYNNKEYAMKIENIIEEEINKDLSSPIWREIEFATTMHKECPNHIMKLYEYDIIENCKHKHKKQYKNDFLYNLENVNNKIYYKNKMNSKYCSRMIYSLVDTTMENIVKELYKKPQEVWYSLFIQYFYVMYCLYKKGYTHNDIHFGNIGIIYTTHKTIKVFKEYKIPTYGLQLVLIDYGRVLNEKYTFTKQYFNKLEKETYKYNRLYEPAMLIQTYISKHPDYLKVLDHLYNTNPHVDLHTNILSIINSKIGININDMIYPKYDGFMMGSFYFYLLVNPDKLQKILIGNKHHKSIKINTIIDIEDYRYIIKNIPIEHSNNIKDIAYYFINKLLSFY